MPASLHPYQRPARVVALTSYRSKLVANSVRGTPRAIARAHRSRSVSSFSKNQGQCNGRASDLNSSSGLSEIKTPAVRATQPLAIEIHSFSPGLQLQKYYFLLKQKHDIDTLSSRHCTVRVPQCMQLYIPGDRPARDSWADATVRASSSTLGRTAAQTNVAADCSLEL